MALVSCFCGAFFAIPDGELGQCPSCAKPTAIPRVTDRDAEEMERDVRAMVDGRLKP